MSEDSVRVAVGSANPNKLDAVKRAFQSFNGFNNLSFVSVASPSGVSDQPVGYEETLSGADNRAQGAYGGSGYGVGLESGLVPVAGTETGYMNLTACVIYDGQRFHRGVGPAFELPGEVCRMVVDGGCELDEAVHRAGLSDSRRIGYAEGIIGLLSNGAVTRADYMVPAVTMALVALAASAKGEAHA
ncbi:inosine/xanthosine triphosphatase [Desulfoluna butyratoxydans]|uniref:Probable inosine/xanthosine triphosphatase n=1 Tax=Desulfoluna butyratoxydans TaxID=231438 RepID=A0A4V6IL61_9BACT|nr:inosine/xanthosine triphosphatase [Desulfoluna butyratoxydans]VFQ43818.1 non-canonical purine ntp phosphatase [Desulfoluna butyratoxydans]